MNYTSRLLSYQEQILICEQFDSFWTEIISLCQQETFLQQSLPAVHPALQNIMEQLSQQRRYKDGTKEIGVSNIMLLQYAPTNFFHGICNINGHMACIVYFSNIGVGMISLCESFFPPETTLTRFCIAINQIDNQVQ